MAKRVRAGDDAPATAAPEAFAGAGAGGGGDAAAKPALYSYWRSSCSWRVRLALALKGIEYEYRAVHLLKDGGEQLKDDYAAMNPMKEVPTLVIDGATLCQSGAILQYLEDTRPDPVPLLPSDPVQRAKVRQVCDSIGCDVQPVQNLRVLKHVMAEKESADDKTKAKLAWGKHWITAGFVGVERILAASAGKYCVGDDITLADLYLVPQVYNANRFGVDMTQFPTITRVNDALAKHPTLCKAHPSAMPDAAP